MEPEEFTNPLNTVYKYEQVLTRNDLIMFIQLLEDNYMATDPRYIEERAHMVTAIKTADALLSWIATGKDREFRGMIDNENI
jgi:hypothetical protein